MKFSKAQLKNQKTQNGVVFLPTFGALAARARPHVFKWALTCAASAGAAKAVETISGHFRYDHW